MSRVFAKPWSDSFDVSFVAEGDNREGFIDVDLDTVARWYWRVKRWRVDASGLSIRGGPIAGTFDFYSHAADQGQQESGGPATERDIILTPGGYEGFMDFGGECQVYVSFFIEPGAGVVAFPSPPAPGNLQRTSLGWRVKAGFAAQAPDQEKLSSITIGGPSAATISFDGINLPLYDSAIGTVEWTGNVSVYPIEYWPYALADGSERIWDGGNGKKLLDHRL